MQKRLEFLKGKQKDFLINSRNELGLSWIGFADELKINRGTLEKAYRYELCSLPYKIFTKICKLRNLPVKSVLNQCKAKIIMFNPKEIIGRKVMGESRALIREPNISYNQKPKKFNLSIIKLSKADGLKKIKFPKKMTPGLAEEIGIHLGDGFLSDKKYEYRLKGGKDEAEYYDIFINNLYKKLYNLDVRIKEYESTYGFEVYSRAIWQFKVECLGISPGRKDSIKLPKILKINDKNILTAFIRGIFDTDGSVSFSNRYGLGKYYPTISISLKSEKLMLEIVEILTMLGFEPKLYRSKDYYPVIHLNGYRKLAKYSLDNFCRSISSDSSYFSLSSGLALK